MITKTVDETKAQNVRRETDGLGAVQVPVDKLRGAHTQRSIEHWSIDMDLIPREMIIAYATLEKAAANATHGAKRLDDQRHGLIAHIFGEILSGRREDVFLLDAWMMGSSTPFDSNVNEGVSNRCCQLAGTPLGGKTPVHPVDYVNMSQSSNDTFPSAISA